MIRIICCGNRNRGDDGAGVFVGERVRELGIPVLVCTGEACSLMDAWSGSADAIVVDTVQTAAAPGTVHIWNAREAQVSVSRSASTHGFGVAEAIALARTLDKLPAKLRVFGIEGSSFNVGAELTRQVKQAAKDVVCELAALYRDSQGT